MSSKMIRPVFDYIQSSVTELRHVSWPSRRDVVQHTTIIIISVAIAMLVIAILDYGLEILVNRFILKS